MRTSLGVQRLRLCASNAGDAGSIPGQGTKIPHAVWCGQKKKKKDVKYNLNIFQFNIILKGCCFSLKFTKKRDYAKDTIFNLKKKFRLVHLYNHISVS